MGRLDEIFSKYKEFCFNESDGKLDRVKEDLKFIPQPEAVGDYRRMFNALSNLKTSVENIFCQSASVEGFKQFFENYLASDVLKGLKGEVDVNTEYENRYEVLLAQKIQEIRDANSLTLKDANAQNKYAAKVEKRRQVLLQYSDVIIDECAKVGVTSSDSSIDSSSFSLEELHDLYGEYIKFIRKEVKKRNPVVAIRDKIPNTFAQAGLLSLFLIILASPILPFIAIVFYILFMKGQVRVQADSKKYAVLMCIVFNCNPYEMGKVSIDESLLLSEDIDEDNDPDIIKLAEDWDSALQACNKEQEDFGIENDRLEIVNRSQEFSDCLKELMDDFYKRKKELLEVLDSVIRKAQDDFEKAKGEVKLLGDEISKSPVLDTKFRLGLKDGIIEEFYDIGAKNIIFRPSKDEATLNKFIQIMFSNVLCNVRAGYCEVIVYDPNKFGQVLLPFYDKELELLLRIEYDKFNEIIEQLRQEALSNMKQTGGKSINDYNTICDQVGKTTLKYKLLVVLSQSKSLEDNEALVNFMSYSAEYGILVWVVSETLNVPDTILYNNPFENVEHPYAIEDMDSFCVDIRKKLVNDITFNKPKALLWQDFKRNVIPDERVWTKVTDEVMELYPGYVGGDPQDYRCYTLGNVGDIHALGAGGTGAGKSVFLNHIILSLARLYSPTELVMWLIDYKGVEFQTYMKSEKFPYALPHVKACICTSDGEYGGSVFAALFAETKRRFDLLQDNGFKNVLSHNEAVRSGRFTTYVDGTPAKTIPRLICINDEFQVIFQNTEDDTKVKIKKDINATASLARAAGVHLFFTSQSMEGTISGNTLNQFSLRFCLRCMEDVSKELLGNNKAAKITEKNGFLYVRSVDDKSPDLQRYYKTPFCDDKHGELLDEIRYLADKAVLENMPQHDVITYREEVTHQLQELQEFYSEEVKRIRETDKINDFSYGTFFLGNRMVYSVTNRAPVNIMLQAGNNTHIMSVFEDMVDYVNFYHTIICNINNFAIKPQVLINSQVDDLNYICELDTEKILDDDLRVLSDRYTTVEDIVGLLEDIYASKVESGDKESPSYFILMGWDKAKGFGIDREFSIITRLTNLLETCGEYNMHVIFIMTTGDKLPEKIVGACRSGIVLGKCSEATSLTLLHKKLASKEYKLDNGYMFVKVGERIERCKTYLYEQTRVVKKKEFVL